MHITYFFDPLCGWCYGAGPAIDHLKQLDDVSISLAPTGLFAEDGARVMDAGFAAFAWENDQRIARLTGQSFTDIYRTRVLGSEASRFDSGPATLALVAVGLTDPDMELSALKTLQRARYVDGFNTGTMTVVCDVLTAAGFVEAAQRAAAPDEQLLSAYRKRIATARDGMAEFGARGVPNLLLTDGPRRRLLSTAALYNDFEQLGAMVRSAT